VVEAAKQAEDLRRAQSGQVVLSVGTELTLFMRGILEGDTFLGRLRHPSFEQKIRSGEHNAPLAEFLARANDAVRQVFKGSVTYASVPLESVDWSRFDFVAVDLYRDVRIRNRFDDLLRRYFAHSRPVVITEFGCCTYRGAADAGGMGWAIVDLDIAEYINRLPELNGEYVRDESEQARELTELLTIFEGAGVDGAFVFTFVAPTSPICEDPTFDLDMASYALVKSYGNRLGDLAAGLANSPWDASRSGTIYPDMRWEPKESFSSGGQLLRAIRRERGGEIERTGRPERLHDFSSVHPTGQKSKKCPQVDGYVVYLSGRHAKLRRDGYRKLERRTRRRG
jgi:hypothetical protein